MSKALADILLRDKVITQKQFTDATEAVKNSTVSPVVYLIKQNQLNDGKLLQYLSTKYGLPSFQINKYEISKDIISLIPQDLVRKLQIIPIQKNNAVLVVAIADPTKMSTLEDVKSHTKLSVEVVLTSFTSLEAAIDKYYGGQSMMLETMKKFKDAKEYDEDEVNPASIVFEVDTGAATNADAPVISLVNQILVEAIRIGASDIHIESYEKKSRVRMRVDGVLQEIISIPPEMRRPLIARIKIMSKMDIAESRLPQDGRIKLRANGKDIDFRVSTMPCLFGEKTVLRLLSQGNLQLDLNKLGFDPRTLESFRKGIHQPSGIVLVTGPTGSGKTTTLYSALLELNQISDNVSTAEDPIEYNLDGINQVQVHREIGLDFANILRTFLRQDPDTILVGEIRDRETAEVAIQAAMTGHLVLSTVHTNDAASTISRLMNMGVESFLLTASINTIVAQRLLRTICSKCKTVLNIPIEKLMEYGIAQESAERMKVYRGKGCNNCRNTGYKGRVAIYEILDFSTNLKELVLRGGSSIELKKAAIEEGMKTLRMAALQKVADGVTTLEEALTMTSQD